MLGANPRRIVTRIAATTPISMNLLLGVGCFSMATISDYLNRIFILEPELKEFFTNTFSDFKIIEAKSTPIINLD